MTSVNEETVSEYRYHLCMTSVREYLILCGGDGENSCYDYNDLWTYNTLNGAWKQFEIPIELGDGCIHHRLVVHGNVVYILSAESVDDDVHQITSLVSFDVSGAKFDTLYARPFDSYDDTPPLMVVCLFFSLNGSMYVMGIPHLEDNEEDDNLEVIYKFCQVTSTWELVPQNGTTPHFVGYPHSTVYKNKLYVLEARLSVSNRFREVWILDFLTFCWTRRDTMSQNQQYPVGRIHESYAFSSNSAFMSGGMSEDWNTTFSDIWRMDLETLEWMKLNDSFKSGAYGHYLSVMNDCFLYNFDGHVHKEGCLNKFERLTLRPPSLYRLSLESVCRSPNMSNNIMLLPPSIVEDLNLDDDNSTLDDDNITLDA